MYKENLTMYVKNCRIIFQTKTLASFIQWMGSSRIFFSRKNHSLGFLLWVISVGRKPVFMFFFVCFFGKRVKKIFAPGHKWAIYSWVNFIFCQTFSAKCIFGKQECHWAFYLVPTIKYWNVSVLCFCNKVVIHGWRNINTN